MIKNKKKLILSLIFFITLISLTIYVNKFNANGWTYLKYNNILYVLNIDTPIAYEQTKELNKVSVIKKNTLPFLKPNRNNTSNGIPKGIEIYSSSQNDDIYILSNKKFYKLYNSTNGAFSISEFANLLGTKLPTGGTNFPGRWVSTMNKATNNKNNYQILRGPDYGITTWREKIKNSSIYTIDKGYPVIADCYIQSYEDRLHPSYNYATDTKHYVGIIGYDDRPQITPALLFIVDFNNRTTIPTTYWSEMNNVTYATDQFGIIW